MNQQLIDYLSRFLTENRFSLFKEISSIRTKYITVVLEDIYQSHNSNAVLRTCDCFGIQDVHIIENRNKFDYNTEVSLGSAKWIDLHFYNKEQNNTETALKQLKEQGYRIVAATPHSDDISLTDFDLKKGKTAIVFGTEKKGISDIVKQNADEFLKIPMYGFTESLNISVSVAIILHYLTYKLRSSDIDWALSVEEQEKLLIQWIEGNINGGDLIIKQYIDTLKN